MGAEGERAMFLAGRERDSGMIQSPQVLGFEMNVFACKTARETAVFKWNKTVLENGL